jgi:flagellar assembly protein FliH
MSSSPSPSPDGARAWRSAERPDLRSGVWTRLGHPSVLGDDVTEQALGRLAERTRTAARAQGYAVGWAEGRREALARAEETARVAGQQAEERERQREAEHRRAVDALLRAAEQLHHAVAEACDLVANQASGLAFEVTRELVRHELALEEDPGAGVVRRALAELPADGVATVRLHPAAAESTAARELAARGVDVQSDPHLEPDDAVVEVDGAAIDLRIGTALDRLREALQ